MGSKNPPDTVRLWSAMECMDKHQLRELATFAMALSALRQRLGKAEDVGAILRGHLSHEV